MNDAKISSRSLNKLAVCFQHLRNDTSQRYDANMETHGTMTVMGQTFFWRPDSYKKSSLGAGGQPSFQ